MKFVPSAEIGGNLDDIISRFINPGEFYFGDSNCQIHTLLGSCVAITLWHPILKVGGMCHIVLPYSNDRRKRADYSGLPLSGRYTDTAMMLFEREASLRGTYLKEYQAKIFGGSNMLTSSKLHEDEQIGAKNIEAAKHKISEFGIPLLVEHVGSTGFRRIAFDVNSGDVWVHHEQL